jgi:hypothetical protein
MKLSRNLLMLVTGVAAQVAQVSHQSAWATGFGGYGGYHPVVCPPPPPPPPACNPPPPPPPPPPPCPPPPPPPPPPPGCQPPPPPPPPEQPPQQPPNTPRPQPKPSVEWSVWPLIYLDVDFKDRLVNLTPGGYSVPDQEQGYKVVADNSITLDDYQSGFRLIQRRKLDLGVGAVLTLTLENVSRAAAGFGAYAGLAPVIGKYAVVDRYVARKEDVKRLPPMRFPQRASDLASWTARDSITYESSGGVLFVAGVGYFGAYAGLNAMATGTWATYVEKEDTGTAYVKITKRKLKSIGVSAGTIIANVGVKTFGESDDSFSYRFNLSSQDAINAFEAMLKGDTLPADKLAANSALTGVTHVTSEKTFTRGFLKTWYLGIPILANRNGAHGKLYILGNTIFRETGAETESHVGVYVNEVADTGFFNRGLRKMNNFFGSHEITRDVNGRTTVDYSGTYKWMYERDTIDAGQFQRQMNRLYRSTGIRRLLNLQAPNANLGYAKLEFETVLNRRAMDLLMNSAVTHSGAVARIAATAEQLRASYFRSDDDPDGLCRLFLIDFRDDERPSGRCVAFVQWVTNRAVRRMDEALARMYATKDRDPDGFSQAFAAFGAELLRNQFVFQSVLDATQDAAPAQMTYRVSGERVSFTEIPLTYVRQ